MEYDNQTSSQCQFEVHPSLLQWPYLEAQGTLPEILKKALSAFEEVRNCLTFGDCSYIYCLAFWLLLDLTGYSLTSVDNVMASG